MAQSLHAVADFAYAHPSLFKEWKETSNTVVALSCKNEQQLLALYDKLKEHQVVLFREPDLDNQATSLGFIQTPEVKRLLRNSRLSLCLKGEKSEKRS